MEPDTKAEAEVPRFMMDHMVIRLGKYLRALGYDAIWGLGVRTHELISAANREGRFFVTRNTRISTEYPQPQKLVHVRADDPAEQLRELCTLIPTVQTNLAFSRCIRCNVELRRVLDKNSIRERVHPNVYARYSQFFVCPRCTTIFWKGSHVRNTCRKLGIPDRSEPSPERNSSHSVRES